MSETSMRFITILGIISFVGTVFIFGNYFSFIIIIFLISTYAFYEWITITSKSKLYILFFLILISLIYYLPFIDIRTLSYITLAIWIVFIAIMFLNANLLKYLIRKQAIPIGLFIFTSFFCILINFFLDNNSVSKDITLIDSKYYLLFFIILLSSVDIFSYLFGKRFGSLKVVSKISPNKTLEGTLFAFFMPAIFIFFLALIFEIDFNNSIIYIFISIMALGAILGDLIGSYFKRNFNVKNSSNLLPGHGGLLDRMDSIVGVGIFFIILDQITRNNSYENILYFWR